LELEKMDENSGLSFFYRRHFCDYIILHNPLLFDDGVSVIYTLIKCTFSHFYQLVFFSTSIVSNKFSFPWFQGAEIFQQFDEEKKIFTRLFLPDPHLIIKIFE
jgi:hypothetical protein